MAEQKVTRVSIDCDAQTIARIDSLIAHEFKGLTTRPRLVGMLVERGIATFARKPRKAAKRPAKGAE